MDFIRKNKVVVIIVVLVLIYAVFMIIFLKNNGANNTKSGESKTSTTSEYLLINNVSNWLYKSNKWQSVSTNSIESSNVTFKSFVNNNYLGEYSLLYGTKWNLIDSNKNIVNYNGNLIAFSNDFNVNIRKNTIRKINSDDVIFIKEKFNISDFTNVTENEAIDIDLDNNGVDDEVVSLSNIGGEVSLNSYFNLVYIKLNGNLVELVNDSIEPKDVLNAKSYYLACILNINNSNSDSVVIGYKYYSNAGNPGNILYEYKDNTFSKIMSD